MPMKCCVPHCLSNYSSHSNQGYVSVFSFPKNINDLRMWLANIPRKDWKPSRTSVVCVKHFDEAEVSIYEKYIDENGDEREKRRSRPVLLPGAVPKIFEELPKCKARSAKRQEAEKWNLRRSLVLKELKELQEGKQAIHQTLGTELNFKTEDVAYQEEAVSNSSTNEQCGDYGPPPDWSKLVETTLHPLPAKPCTSPGPRLEAPPTVEGPKRFSDLAEAKLQLVNMQTEIHRLDSLRKRKFEEGKYRLEIEILRKRLHFEEEKHKLELQLLKKELEIKDCILKQQQERSQ